MASFPPFGCGRRNTILRLCKSSAAIFFPTRQHLHEDCTSDHVILPFVSVLFVCLLFLFSFIYVLVLGLGLGLGLVCVVVRLCVFVC